MARKATKPKPDADGYLRTGIYQRYVGKPKRNARLTEKKLEKWVASCNAPATDDLARIKAWLITIIKPWVDGPLSNDEARKPVGRAIRSFDFGDGPGCYRDKAGLERQEQYVIDAFRDAAKAWHEMHVVEHNLKSGVVNGLLFRSLFRLGQLCERISIRPFEPLVSAEKGRRDGARRAIAIVNEDHAELRPQYQAEVDKQMANSGISYSAACREVAHLQGVCERTVKNHTVNPSPRNRGPR